ncbi:circadian clock-controlled protein daywake-like [Galleria mellonella]|uniref:Circadian clock-controlled protein daywake-like n=1 Tax=Galleria mellonella TaxID=7137 RepID=A0ABM3MVE2_GALME|nr:circadian clock-controlled protein daywake-like [Galleria mellonella]
MSVQLTSFVFVIQLAMIFAEIPPIHKCKISDTACLMTSAQSALPAMAVGIPEMNLEPLDIMDIDKIKVDLAGLKLGIKDAHIKGLKGAIIDKLSIDIAKKLITLVFHADVVMNGHYKASGRLLILPINGDGQTTIKLKNLVIEMIMPFEIRKNSDGKDFIEVKSYKYKYDVKTNANFRLTNLFNGNKQLSDTMHNFMNENWKVLVQEFGTPMLDIPNAKIFAVIKTFFKSRPMEDVIEM